MQRSSPRASAGLSMLAASMAPSAAPAPTSVCSSSMKRMILPCRGLDLLEHGLEPILELAAELGAGDHGRQVQRDELLVLERLGDVAAHDALGEALDDGGLADAGLADEHGVVLGAAREDLHHPADLLVAADDRIDLAAPGERRQIARVLLERLELALGIAIGDALVAAHARQRLEELVVAHARALQEALHVLVGLGGGEEHVLGGDEVVLEGLGLVLGLLQDGEGAAREVGLRAAADARVGVDLCVEGAQDVRRIGARLLQERPADAVRPDRGSRGAGAPDRARGSRAGWRDPPRYARPPGPSWSFGRVSWHLGN